MRESIPTRHVGWGGFTDFADERAQSVRGFGYRLCEISARRARRTRPKSKDASRPNIPRIFDARADANAFLLKIWPNSLNRPFRSPRAFLRKYHSYQRGRRPPKSANSVSRRRPFDNSNCKPIAARARANFRHSDAESIAWPVAIMKTSPTHTAITRKNAAVAHL